MRDFRGNVVSAGPAFGRPRFDRFRHMMDDAGVEYAVDNFTYTAAFGDIVSGASSQTTININRDSAFEAVSITGGAAEEAGGAVSVTEGIDLQIADGASNRNLLSGPVPIMNFVGDGRFPFIMPIPRRFMPSSQVQLVAHNYSPNDLFNVQVSFTGRKIFMAALAGRPLPRFRKWSAPNGMVYSEDFYIYDFELDALAPAATQPITQLIENDSDFEWILTTATSLTGETSIPISAEGLDVQVEDGGSQRKMIYTSPVNLATALENVAGTGAQPFILPQPRIFLAKSPVIVTLTNRSAAEIDDIHVSLIGRKIFEQD